MNGCTKRRVQAPHEWENAMNICQKLFTRDLIKPIHVIQIKCALNRCIILEFNRERERKSERARMRESESVLQNGIDAITLSKLNFSVENDGYEVKREFC